MDPIRFRPAASLLVVWVAGAGLCALAVGKAVAGLCTVLARSSCAGFVGAFMTTWLVGALASLAYFRSLRYTLDKHHVTKAAGVLWRCRRSIPLDKITNIAIRQGPIDQVLRTGQVLIYTPSSGSDAPEERLVGMRDPTAVRDAIMQRAEAVLPATGASALQEKREIVALLTEIRDRLAHLEGYLVPPESRTCAMPPATAGEPASDACPSPHTAVMSSRQAPPDLEGCRDGEGLVPVGTGVQP